MSEPTHGTVDAGDTEADKDGCTTEASGVITEHLRQDRIPVRIPAAIALVTAMVAVCTECGAGAVVVVAVWAMDAVGDGNSRRVDFRCGNQFKGALAHAGAFPLY